MPTVHCPIESIKYFNHDTRQVILRLPAKETISFKAGQYLEILVAEKKCPFSIACAPLHQHVLELHIRPTPDSEDSIMIEQLLDNADHLDIELPKGDCFLEVAPPGPLLLLAASTGITQMKSIIEHLVPQGIHQPTFLYWGVVSGQDLYLSDLCKHWEHQHSQFHYIPVISEPDISPDWVGRTGLVSEAALSDIDDIADFTVYVGGGPSMVYATLDMLVSQGLPEKNLHSDVFSYALSPEAPLRSSTPSNCVDAFDDADISGD